MVEKYSLEYYFNSETVFVCLIILLFSIIGYSYLFPSYPDINEYFLKEQSSIANIRLPAETAVYRSKISPHGRELISGLSIASDGDYRTRDGDIVDIWKLVLKTKIPIATAVVNDQDVLGNFTCVPLPVEELNRLVHGIGQEFLQLTNGNDSSSPKNIVIALGTNLEAMICFFAASLYGFCSVFIHNIENTDVEGLNQSIQIANPDVIISSGSIIENLELNRFSHLNGIISVHDKVFNDKSFTNIKYISWPDLLTKSKSAHVKDINELPKVLQTPLQIVYTSKGFDNSDIELKIALFSNKSIVSSIASQIKSLPTSQQWTTKDTILTYNSQFNSYNFILQLCSLVTGSKLVFVNTSNIIYNPLQLISDIKPTVMITEDTITSSLSHLSDDLGFLDSIRYYRSISQISKGNLPKQAILPELKSLRIIHSGKYQEDDNLSTEETNKVRVLTGAYFIHALNTPQSLSPIAQTSIYDYRTSNANKWIHFGPPLPCLEVKLRDFRNYKSTNRSGQLLIRGHSLPTGTEWIEENLIIHLGNDGCIKQLLDIDYSIPQ